MIRKLIAISTFNPIGDQKKLFQFTNFEALAQNWYKLALPNTRVRYKQQAIKEFLSEVQAIDIKSGLPKIRPNERLELTQTFFTYACQNQVLIGVDPFLAAIAKCKKQLPASIYSWIINPRHHGQSVEELINTIQVLIDQKTSPFLQSIVCNSENIRELRDRLKTAFPDEFIVQTRTQEELVKLFQSDPTVQFPVSQLELSTFARETVRIQTAVAEIIRQPGDKFIRALQKIVRPNRKNSEKNRLKVVASLVAFTRLYMGLRLHDTQILVLLSLLKYPEKFNGRMVRMLTGQGKSIMFVLFASFYAAADRTVDISTTDTALARDVEKKHRGFFRQLRFSSLCLEESDYKPGCMNAQIIFAKSTTFEFAYLFQLSTGAPIRFYKKDGKMVPRPLEAVGIDEADSVLMDQGTSDAIISGPEKEGGIWIYKEIVKFIEPFSQFDQSMLPSFRDYLKSQKVADETIDIFSDTQLEIWLRSSFAARLHRDRVHYKKIDDRIVIVDVEHTGRLMEGNEWHGGHHQFLQIKESLPINPEHYSSARISHFNYFNQYLFRAGLTGTLGGKELRTSIETLYNMATYDAPPEHPVNRTNLGFSYFKNRDGYYQKMCARASEMTSKNRSVLILATTIERSSMISQFLESQGFSTVLINEENEVEEEFAIERAGYPGSVTIATATATRGTDFILHQKVVKSGGKHVIWADIPANDRVRDQGNGRAARQKQPGSCEMIICGDDPFFRQHPLLNILAPTMSDQELKQEIDKIQEQMIQKSVQAQAQRSSLSKIYFDFQSEFFDQLSEWEKRLNEKELKKISTLRNHLRPEFLANTSPLSAIISHKQVVRDQLILGWAKFLDALDHQIRGEAETDLSAIQSQFSKFMASVRPYFENPPTIFLRDRR